MSTVCIANEVKINNFQHLKIRVVPENNTAWLYFDPEPRACFTLKLLQELSEYRSILKQENGKLPHENQLVDIEYNVLTSHHSVFSFGGDLEFFINCIESGDRDALRTYAQLCIDAVYFDHTGGGFDITAISLANGNALGGGFEAVLSCPVVIAERNAQMGLPEVLFNLFPGMGAYNFLSYRLNSAMAEKMILSGRLYSSEELFDMGVVDVLAENGEGESAVNSYIRACQKRKNTMDSVKKVRQLVSPINYQQLLDIGDIWVDAAFKIAGKDLRTMNRLVRSQRKHSAREHDAQEGIDSAIGMVAN